MSAGFQFKQFYVAHDKCAMKVGTDGVLVGASLPLPPLSQRREGVFRILDIGTGTGLVAMMVAQKASLREEWEIDAIDIDPEAVGQARENFERSPWSEHLHAYQCSLQDYLSPCPSTGKGDQGERGYDLIVSNPPYFVDSMKNPDAQRTAARHTDTLSHEELIRHCRRLLAPTGIVHLILPIEAEEELLRTAERYRLYPTRLLYIRTTARKAPKRFIVSLSPALPQGEGERRASGLQECVKETLTLMGENGEMRSREYAELCRDYYL